MRDASFFVIINQISFTNPAKYDAIGIVLKAEKGRGALFGDITSMQKYRQDTGGYMKEEAKKPPQVKSKQRVTDHGEVFMAESEVKGM